MKTLLTEREIFLVNFSFCMFEAAPHAYANSRIYYRKRLKRPFLSKIYFSSQKFELREEEIYAISLPNALLTRSLLFGLKGLTKILHFLINSIYLTPNLKL